MTKVTHLTLNEEGGGLNRRRIHLREISGDADAPLETVGQDLRAARLRRGDDLATVSKCLKIRKDHLEALEEDRVDALPGRTYAVGFVRTYSDYLGLDVVQCVERFKAEIAGRNNEDTPTITVIDEADHRRLPQGWKIIAAVVLVLLVYGAYHLATSTDQMLSQPVAAVPDQIAQKPVVAAVAPPPVQAPAPTTDAAVNTDPSATPVPAPAAPTQAPVATASVPAATPLNGVYPSGPAVPAEPVGKAYGQPNRSNARVVLRVHQATRLLVQGPDGTVYLNRTLQPGDYYYVPNLVGITLTAANAGAVQVDLDGTAMGVAGRDQQVTEALSLDPQAIVDRHNGHGPG